MGGQPTMECCQSTAAGDCWGKELLRFKTVLFRGLQQNCCGPANHIAASSSTGLAMRHMQFATPTLNPETRARRQVTLVGLTVLRGSYWPIKRVRRCNIEQGNQGLRLSEQRWSRCLQFRWRSLPYATHRAVHHCRPQGHSMTRAWTSGTQGGGGGLLVATFAAKHLIPNKSG